MPEKRVLRRAVTPVQDEEVASPPRMAAAKPSNGESRDGHTSEVLRGGWTEAQKQVDSTSSYAQSFRPEAKATFMAFLDDSPYVSFRRHWIERANKDAKPGEKKTITRAYTCPMTFGKPCPLCVIGDKAQAVSCFNIVIIGDDGQVLHRSWDINQKRLLTTIKEYQNDPKIGPLSKGFFMVKKSGEGTATTYPLNPVPRGSLTADYDITPPTAQELASIVKYTPAVVELTPFKVLEELAAELDSEYD